MNGSENHIMLFYAFYSFLILLPLHNVTILLQCYNRLPDKILQSITEIYVVLIIKIMFSCYEK